MMFALSSSILAESRELSPQQWFLIIAAIILATFLLLRNSRRRAMGGSPRQYTREIDSATLKSTAVKRDMEQLLIELNELARQINGQIDTKFAKLEQSIADADKRISALRILIDAANKANAATLERLQKSEDPARIEAPESAARPQLDVVVHDDGETGEVVAAPEASEPTEQDSTAEPEEQESDSADDEIRDRICGLADRGRSPVEIAQELQRTVGEVELILNLRPSRRKAE